MKARSNKEFLTEEYEIKLGNDIYDNNKIANELFDLNSEELTVFGESIDRNNYYYLFANDGWLDLDLSKKLKILKWAISDYLYSNDFTLSFFFHDDNLIKNSNAIAQKNNIVLNLDSFNEMSGYEALETIIHEATHVIDSNKFVELRKKFLAYIPDDIVNEYLQVYDYIMKMELKDAHYNKYTKQEEYFDKQTQDDLLMLKNLIVTINPNTELKSRKISVKNKDDFFEYIRNICYQISPLEYRAFTTSQKYAFDVMEKYETDYNLPEFQELFKRSRNLRGKKKQLSNYFNRPVEEIINDSLVYEYNKSTYGIYKDYYICKEKMENWEKDMEKIWNSKFRQDFPSRMAEWIEKDNNTLNI